MHRTFALVVALCACFAVASSALTQDATTEMEQGKRHYRNGDFRSAISSFTAVVAAESDSAEALYLIGYSHVMLREFTEAADAFARTFAADAAFDPRTIFQRAPAADAIAD